MLYRLLLTGVISMALAACFWDDYKKSESGNTTPPAENREETLPDSGVVANGNLEGSATDATGWDSSAPAGAAVFGLSSAQYYSGRTSYKASINTPGADSADIFAGPAGVPVQEGYTYYFSAWVFGTAGAVANFVAQAESEAMTELGAQEIEVTSAWQRVSFDFVAPAGVMSVRLPAQLSYAQNAGADIYIDHVSLKEVAPTGSVTYFEISEGLPGWSVDQAANSLSYDENLGVVINPDWSKDDQVAMYIMAEPMDATGLTFEFVITIPKEYLDAGISIQPYIQQNSGGYAGDYSGYIDFGSLNEGVNFISYTPKNPPADTQRIGLMVKGAARSSEPSSAISISSIYYESEAGSDSGSDLAMDKGWSWPEAEGPDYSDTGVSFSPTADDQGISYDLQGPKDLEGATLVFTIAVDQAYKDSGASLQPYAQQNFGDVAEWNCWADASGLSIEGAQHRCTLDEAEAAFNLGEGESIKVGVKAKGEPAGTVTISQVQIEYPSLAVTSNWRASNAEPSYDKGVAYPPTADGHSLVTDVEGPNNFEGATFVFTLEASQEFIDSQANLQPFAQVTTGGSSVAEWGCWINNQDLQPEGGEYRCTLKDPGFNLPEGAGMQIGVQAKGDAPKGTIKITAVRIIYAD